MLFFLWCLGVGNYECEGTVPVYSPPRFPASVFFFVIFVWTTTAAVAFEVLCRSSEHVNASRARDAAHEETPLSTTKPKTQDQLKEDNEEAK
ncbi:hypothetical protein OESDEN_12473, partial [Oesophagostomum dentatum]